MLDDSHFCRIWPVHTGMEKEIPHNIVDFCAINKMRNIKFLKKLFKVALNLPENVNKEL